MLHYSPIRAGLAFLPVTVAIVTAAGLASSLLSRFGPKPFMVTGSLLAAGGMGRPTLIGPDSSYTSGLPLLFGFGMGLNFVTLTLTAVSGVAESESGAASGMLNTTQQVGGALGLSILATVFSSASTSEGKTQIRKFLAEGTPEQKLRFAKTHTLPAPWSDSVLAHSISTAFVASTALAVAAALIALFVIKVRKRDLLAGAAGPGPPRGDPGRLRQAAGRPAWRLHSDACRSPFPQRGRGERHADAEHIGTGHTGADTTGRGRRRSGNRVRWRSAQRP